MSRNYSIYGISLVISGLLTACASVPERPSHSEILTDTAKVPADWTDRTQNIISRLGNDAPDTVWEGFNDPSLPLLVQQAITATPSAREAQARLILARTRSDLDQARLRPSLSVGSVATRERSSLEGPQFTNLPPQFVDFVEPEIDVFSLSASASWEPDIWGRRALEVQSAQFSVEAAAAQRDATLLSLQADTARTYIQLRSVQTRASITREALELLEETQKLTLLLQDQDLVSALDELQVSASIDARLSELATLEGQEVEFLLSVATLTGQALEATNDLTSGSGNIPDYSSGIPAGLPSTLLTRRPDLRAASARLQAARAQSDADDLNRLPSFSLTGDGGLLSTTLDTLISTDARRGAISGILGWPIFQGGALAAQREASDAEVLIAEAQYDAAILRAFSDVEGALSRYVAAERAMRRLDDGIDDRKRIVDLRDLRFKAGLDNQFLVIEAQTQLLELRLARVQAQATSALAIVDLFSALGGEW